MIILGMIGLLAACAPRVIGRRREELRRLELARQLRRSLQNMVHALKVGVGFMQALEHSAKESAEPLATEWRRLIQTVKLGQSLSRALEDLSERVPIKQMKWFVAAVQITQSTGGSLAGVLETLAAALQDQETLREKVDALTAQGKASGILISCLPFLVIAALFLIAPEMVRPLFTTWLGQGLMAGVLVMITVGSLLINKIVSVPVG